PAVFAEARPPGRHRVPGRARGGLQRETRSLLVRRAGWRGRLLLRPRAPESPDPPKYDRGGGEKRAGHGPPPVGPPTSAIGTDPCAGLRVPGPGGSPLQEGGEPRLESRSSPCEASEQGRKLRVATGAEALAGPGDPARQAERAKLLARQGLAGGEEPAWS